MQNLFKFYRLAVMFKLLDYFFKIDFMQHQTNVDDCGVFAIAFAMAICSGRNPEELQFNVSVMRQHLFKCLEKQQMSLFPATQRLIDPTSSKTEIHSKKCSVTLH